MAGANQRIYKIAGTGLGASMWFFLFYRAKKDGIKSLSKTMSDPRILYGRVTRTLTASCIGPVLLGWKHPWEH
ncbi:hypothetical protein V8F06_006785 [Rhypophila decipiens]